MVAIDDGTVPGASPQEKKETLERWARYNLDRYYEVVEDLTFPTAFLPLPLADARLLTKGSLPDGLKDDLNAAIQRVGGSDGAFVRLTTRSPKDAVDKMPERLAPLLEEALRGVPEDDQNATLIALRRAFAQTLRIHSADEALFIMSLSGRTISDVIRMSSHPDADQFWDMQLVVRKFCDLPAHGEFRVFVHSGQVRGISQYDTLCYFPHLVQQKAAIAALILQFHEALHQRVGHLFDDYVLDLALLDNPAEAAPTPHQVLLVEINPWDTHTGAALFNWEQDKQILEGSEGEVEVRVVEEDRKPVFTTWQPLVDAARQRCNRESGDGRDQPTSGGRGKGDDKCVLS